MTELKAALLELYGDPAKDLSPYVHAHVHIERKYSLLDSDKPSTVPSSDALAKIRSRYGEPIAKILHHVLIENYNGTCDVTLPINDVDTLHALLQDPSLAKSNGDILESFLDSIKTNAYHINCETPLYGNSLIKLLGHINALMEIPPIQHITLRATEAGNNAVLMTRDQYKYTHDLWNTQLHSVGEAPPPSAPARAFRIKSTPAEQPNIRHVDDALIRPFDHVVAFRGATKTPAATNTTEHEPAGVVKTADVVQLFRKP